MIISTMVKLKTLGFAKQVVAGAFINGALIGGAMVAGAVIASKARSGDGPLCKAMRTPAPQDPKDAHDQGM
jgi:hypothetical protein